MCRRAGVRIINLHFVLTLLILKNLLNTPLEDMASPVSVCLGSTWAKKIDGGKGRELNGIAVNIIHSSFNKPPDSHMWKTP